MAVDAKTTQAIIDNNGNQPIPQPKLKLNYRPDIILFNESDEFTRINGFL
ncbi:hypothetical protein [Candidatus Ruthturnera calyptogenae]|nr:hypothetical protein [Candidatus Ruthturnera calyptogenae]